MIALGLLTATILGVVRAEDFGAPSAGHVDEPPASPEKLHVVFVNESPDTPIDLYFENDVDLPDDDPERRILEASIPPRGGYHSSGSFVGHEFSYVVGGNRHYILPPDGNANGEQFLVLAGEEDEFRVRCEVSVYSQKSTETFDIIVKPHWAPRGASRFLELVRGNYYNGVALNRVVPNLITRFGIAKNFDVRSMQKRTVIWDDIDPGIEFEPGFVSFAGDPGIHDRRSTELFIVSPNISPEQLEKYGEESYEMPFGFVEDKNSALTKIYSGYGNTGPDTAVMYESDGYDYLEKNFPKLDYIERCYIVDEVGLPNWSDGEEL